MTPHAPAHAARRAPQRPAAPNRPPIPHRPSRPRRPQRAEAGLATLEWLLVIAAAGGFAAAMAVGLDSLLDDARAVRHDTGTRLVEAGIAAARITDDAIDALIALETAPSGSDLAADARQRLDALERQCAHLGDLHRDTVESAVWAWHTVPVPIPATATALPPTMPTGTSTAGTAPAGTSAIGTAPPADIGDSVAASLTDGRWACQISHRAR